MKIVVFSDSHGNLSDMDFVLRRRKHIDAVLFCGDGHEDIARMQKKYPDKQYYAVKGNCDWYCDYPTLLTVTLGGKKLLLTHGHCQYVKQGTDHLVSLAHQENADIVVFGHTHHQLTTVEEGILLINPGSVGYDECYSLLQIDDKTGRIVVTEFPDDQYGPVIIDPVR